jgi:hypothetical protein
MLVRLATNNKHSLQVRIHTSSNFKCPFFVFKHCDNKGHPLVGGWHNDTLTLPKQRDGQSFTSLIQLFRFLVQAHTETLSIPQDWTLAFWWTRHDEWRVDQIEPFSTFLTKYQCYVHDEPPYQLYFTGYGPKVSPPPPPSFEHQFTLPKLDCVKKTMSFNHLCHESWISNAPIPVYTNSNAKMNRQIWKRFLTRHQILSHEDSSALFDSHPSPNRKIQVHVPQIPHD